MDNRGNEWGQVDAIFVNLVKKQLTTFLCCVLSLKQSERRSGKS